MEGFIADFGERNGEVDRLLATFGGVTGGLRLLDGMAAMIG